MDTSPVFSSLPQDIMIQILSLLSLKNSTTLKSISKSWYTLLNDPEFHSLLLNHKRRIIVVPNDFQLQSITIEGVDCPALIEKQEFPRIDDSDMLMKGMAYFESCNGLMLTSNQFRKLFLLWNPTTRTCMKLSEYDEGFPTRRGESCCFAGLGFDSLHDDYKVVIGFTSFDAYIYSRKTNLWKRIQDYYGYEVISNKLGKFTNGCMHWLAWDCYQNDGYVIMTLDLVEENFDTIALPDFCGDTKDNNIMCNMGVLEGLLYIVVCRHISDYDANGAWAIWLMKNYRVKDSWTKLMELSLPKETHTVKPLCIMENSDVILEVNSSKIIKFDPNTKQFTTLLENMYYFESVLITESLNSPHCKSSKET